MKALDTKNSTGGDGLHPLILSECASSFSKALSLIFNKSFKEGVIPKDWKEANICPLFKKGSKTDPANYRPLSLTVIPCKVQEKIIRKRMIQHLVDNGTISINQHGFVNSKSCLTNLLETHDIITEALNRGFSIDLALLDFSKAFDLVVHVGLLLKTKSLGFDKDIVDWIKAFLSDRRQRVVMGDISSEWQFVTSGVPQGSVLGPLLFIIYINDMPDLLEHFCKLFADDSKLIGIIKNSFDSISFQKDLD